MSALGVKRTSHRALPGRSTTQNDINLGIVNIIVGLAPPKPPLIRHHHDLLTNLHTKVFFVAV
jgi:hypothetical protein